MERELACFRQKLIPYGILYIYIYIYFNNPLWYYIMVSSYCGFYLCFCLGHDGKYILLRVRQVQTICLLYCVFVVLVLLFLSYLGLRSLSHSLEIFEAKLNPLV